MFRIRRPPLRISTSLENQNLIQKYRLKFKIYKVKIKNGAAELARISDLELIFNVENVQNIYRSANAVK